MFADFQAQLVAHLEEKRQATATSGGPAEGRIAPLVVKPYGGELLSPQTLLMAVPVVFVEFDSGIVEPEDIGGSAASGILRPDVIVCARNAASGRAQYADGVALATWTLEALLGARLEFAGFVASWERVSMTRLQNAAIWTAVLTPEFDFS